MKIIDIFGKFCALIAIVAIAFSCAGFISLSHGVSTIITGMLICIVCESIVGDCEC